MNARFPSRCVKPVSSVATIHYHLAKQPIYPPDDHSGLARLRALVSMPIAAGENCSSLMEFKRLMEVGAVPCAPIVRTGGAC